jgi:hypothetical protein
MRTLDSRAEPGQDAGDQRNHESVREDPGVGTHIEYDRSDFHGQSIGERLDAGIQHRQREWKRNHAC